MAEVTSDKTLGDYTPGELQEILNALQERRTPLDYRLSGINQAIGAIQYQQQVETGSWDASVPAPSWNPEFVMQEFAQP